MAEAQTRSVMRRKLAAGRRPADQFGMTPEKALAQALARSAQGLMSLPLRVLSQVETRMTLADLPEALPERALLAMLQGPEEATGLMVLSPPLLAGLIEMRTMGRLSGAPPAPRRPTRTDAAMTADFIDAVFVAMEEMLAGDPALTWVGGFRYGSFLDDPRPLPLVLEDTNYRVFRLVLTLGVTAAAREGELLIALPADGRGVSLPVAAGAAGSAAAEDEAAAQWAEAMERTLMAAPAQLEAVLARITLPVARILSLKPGMVLPLDAEMLSKVQLEGPGGRAMIRGQLGQHRGYRAVRLNAEAEAESPPMSFGGLAPPGAFLAPGAPSGLELDGPAELPLSGDWGGLSLAGEEEALPPLPFNRAVG